MPILNENGLLSDEERETFHRILKNHNHHPDHFLIEVMEDQKSMDMNDLSYVVIVSTKATHLGSEKSKTYYSRAKSGTWLAEFEHDIKMDYFKSE